jgi:hypothetical protein
MVAIIMTAATFVALPVALLATRSAMTATAYTANLCCGVVIIACPLIVAVTSVAVGHPGPFKRLHTSSCGSEDIF